MKKIFTTITILFLVVTNFYSQTNKPNTEQNKNLTDTMFFDLSQAVYSTVGSVNYIEFPVWIKSSSTQISSFDFWHQFDLNKLTYVSTTSLLVGLDAFSNFNVNNSYLSNTTSGSSITFIVPTNTNLIKVKYSINGNCTTILPSDFFSITALIVMYPHQNLLRDKVLIEKLPHRIHTVLILMLVLVVAQVYTEKK